MSEGKALCRKGDAGVETVKAVGKPKKRLQKTERTSSSKNGAVCKGKATKRDKFCEHKKRVANLQG